MRQLCDTNTGPSARFPWKHAVFNSPENVHVLAHVDVIGCHINNVVKGALALGQDKPKVFPGCNELTLRILNDIEIKCAADLASAKDCSIYSHRRCVSSPLSKGLH